MTVTEIVQIGSMGLLTVTLFISILTYRRNKKVELQNHLYKMKLDAFANIVYEIEMFTVKADKMVRLIQELSDHIQNEESKSKLFEIADALDEELYKCNAIIVKNSVYFSAASTELLSRFSDNIFGNPNSSPGLNKKDYFDKFDEYYANQLELANEAVEKVREELGLEKLNRSLYGRVS